MKRLNLLFVLLLLAIAASMRAEATFDFSTSLPKGWTATVMPYGYEERGAQFTGNTCLTLPGVSEVKQVTILCSANEDNVNSIEVKVGDVSLGKKQLPKGNNQTLTFESNTALEGELNILITRTKKSVWIKTVTIDGQFDSSLISDEDLTEGLESDYVYAEPTKVVSVDSLGSKIPYTFICNNVKVIASMGGKTSQYFSANAQSEITFVTTRKMKALVVDGFLRKGFSAGSSAGKIVYKSTDAVDLEEEQVLAVTDIDTNVVTLTCDKQLRCYELRVYFEANPEIDIETAYGSFTYYYEPEETKEFNLRFDSLKYVDMTDNLGYACTSLLFTSGEAELNMAVFASTIDGETILPVGTYPINDSYTANTVQASPGGDEYMDYPSYLATDFELGGNGNWLYNPYYLVSGAMEVLEVEGSVYFAINATSYNGSTIKGEYMRAKGEPNVDDAVEQVTYTGKTSKVLRDGRLTIQRNGAVYTIDGVQL